MGKTRRTVRRRARVDGGSVENPSPPEADSRGAAACESLRTISNPIALDILTILASAESSIVEIVESTELPRTLVSMYLCDFCRRGILAKDGKGDARRYRLVDARVRAIVTGLSAPLAESGLA